MILHIFKYGEDQYIDGEINKKFDNETLTYHNATISSLNIIDNDYKVITYYNDSKNFIIDYFDFSKNINEKATQAQVVAFDDLINEIIEK